MTCAGSVERVVLVNSLLNLVSCVIATDGFPFCYIMPPFSPLLTCPLAVIHSPLGCHPLLVSLCVGTCACAHVQGRRVHVAAFPHSCHQDKACVGWPNHTSKI
jgi:hypothetical protein